jgi:hypothetical protein
VHRLQDAGRAARETNSEVTRIAENKKGRLGVLFYC